MLTYLRVRNLAVLRDVEAGFGAGLNVLSGETGAGKSILVDAVGLLLGDRAGPDQIRQGENRAVVEGQFAPVAAEAAAELEAAGLEIGEDGSIVVRRELLADGPNRVFINDGLTSLAVLRRVLAGQVALHGQNRHLTLASPEAQRRFMDQAYLPASLRQDLESAWTALREAVARREEHGRQGTDRLALRDVLRLRLQELDGARLARGEVEALLASERRLASGEERRRLSTAIIDHLMDSDDAVAATLGRARDDLARLAQLDTDFGSAEAELSECLFTLQEVVSRVRAASDDEDADDVGRLDGVQERLAAIQRLERKYGTDVSGLLILADESRRTLADLEDVAGATSRLEEKEAQAAAAYHALALEVSGLRQQAAASLTREVQAELPGLGLLAARFAARSSVAPPPSADPAAVRQAGGPAGYGGEEFLFTANPGEEPRPLQRVASGGELSRLLLALYLVTDGGSAPGESATFIYDEIDAGVGGETARLVGERLQKLASRHQVICVTHMPQIAALAARHLRIEKSTEQGRAVTRVRSLAAAEREDELARMLGGGASLETAKQHARALLAGEPGGKPSDSPGRTHRPAARAGG